jgi:hypothetical protein
MHTQLSRDTDNVILIATDRTDRNLSPCGGVVLIKVCYGSITDRQQNPILWLK